ncbi:uncharacterized protein LOC125038259 isoform X2 [Penaeus chinensis]|uniref:uncharacterized protein LOC125038259 isoform X2 n=1 Tax=Penaeus chinensis TaxID=139456 RepID=UPI001FB638A4|nr:uncharacterized protein LOC125038259 isoform X2 [Penaeus chinensis]
MANNSKGVLMSLFLCLLAVSGAFAALHAIKRSPMYEVDVLSLKPNVVVPPCLPCVCSNCRSNEINHYRQHGINTNTTIDI